jgi:putative DNA-invertase from lambdoid prophage Rac
MLAVFAEFEREILRERVKAGIAQSRVRGQPHGRPPTVKTRSAEIKRLLARGLSKREIAKRLKVGRTSVRRVLTQKDPRP